MPQQPMYDPRWCESWRAVSTRMEQLRCEELACVSIADTIEALEEAFQAAMRHSKPSTTSGLVTQQTLFRKGRR